MKQASTDEEIKNDPDYKIEAVIYRNLMPGSNSSPYMNITVKPADSTHFKSSIKLTHIIVYFPSGDWESTNFDRNKYMGKGQQSYQNVTRDLPNQTSGSVGATLTIQEEDGNTVHQRIDHIRVEEVH